MARDLIHDAVKAALINDGWVITDDPFQIELLDDERTLAADLGAEKMFAAEKDSEKIAVEIKTFGGTSILNKFHEALGQYLDYRDAMEEIGVQRILFLAVSVSTFAKINAIKFIKRRIVQYQIKILVVDVNNEKIKAWKS